MLCNNIYLVAWVREIRIYQQGDYAPGDIIELSEEAGLHVGVVLRMQVGECLSVFNGCNQQYTAVIHAVKKKRVSVLIEQCQEVSRESPLAIHLGQAISKGERMELVMQKAVELGVARITPVITSRSVVKLDRERMAKKLQQWQAIVIAACEQSGRNTVPVVAAPMTFSDFVQGVEAELKLILQPEQNKSWRDYNLSVKDIALVIGPEGGLTADELDEACAQHFSPLTLGPRILRTETAAITVLSLLQAVGGDL